MQAKDINPALKPISWLIGKWKSTSAKGTYPTIDPFEYCEEIEFTSIGQPMLNYSSVTWHPENKNPMHLESGFLRIKPGTGDVAFMVAHNFGLTTIEEGTVDGKEVKLKSTEISRMSFAKEPAVCSVERTIKLHDDCLHISVLMQTSKSDLTQHLNATYQKV